MESLKVTMLMKHKKKLPLSPHPPPRRFSLAMTTPFATPSHPPSPISPSNPSANTRTEQENRAHQNKKSFHAVPTLLRFVILNVLPPLLPPSPLPPFQYLHYFLLLFFFLFFPFLSLKVLPQPQRTPKPHRQFPSVYKHFPKPYLDRFFLRNSSSSLLLLLRSLPLGHFPVSFSSHFTIQRLFFPLPRMSVRGIQPSPPFLPPTPTFTSGIKLLVYIRC